MTGLIDPHSCSIIDMEILTAIMLLSQAKNGALGANSSVF